MPASSAPRGSTRGSTSAHRSTRVLVAGALIAAIAGGTTACSAPAPDSPATPAAVAATVAPAHSPTALTTDAALARFTVPVRLQAPAGMPLEVAEPTLLTWKVATGDDEKIRVMAPTVVMPDGAAPKAAPADYFAYLSGLRTAGARITSDVPIRIDGVRGHRFTITSTRVIDGGLGCWSSGDDGCFGLPPDLSLSMATFEVGGRPIVLWARTLTAHPDPALVARFDAMLRGVRFSR